MMRTQTASQSRVKEWEGTRDLMDLCANTTLLLGAPPAEWEMHADGNYPTRHCTWVPETTEIVYVEQNGHDPSQDRGLAIYRKHWVILNWADPATPSVLVMMNPCSGLKEKA